MDSLGINTHWLFPIACTIASAIFCSMFIDKKKFGYLISAVVGLAVGYVVFLTLPY
jgi:hypothetical protein